MEETDQVSNIAEEENQNPDNTKEVYNSTSGPALTVPGVQDLLAISDIKDMPNGFLPNPVSPRKIKLRVLHKKVYRCEATQT